MYKLICYEVKCFSKDFKTFDNCLWHGGKLVEFNTPNKKYVLYARGIVDCDLIAKRDYIDDSGNFYKAGDVIESFKDKNEDGLFKEKLEYYIKTDKKLMSILMEEDEDLELEFANNNWLELDEFDEFGEYVDSDVLDYDCISEAIDCVIDLIKEEQLNIKSNLAMYCRTATLSDGAIENQKQLCLGKINLDNPDVDSIICYIDNGFSSTDKFPPTMQFMIEDIKKNNVKNIYVHDMSRLSRNVNKFIDIRELLKENNSDIFLIKEGKYVSKELFNELTIPLLSMPLENHQSEEIDLKDEIERE